MCSLNVTKNCYGKAGRESRDYYFPSVFIIWKENHPLNANVFLTFTCQLKVYECPILNLNFFHQIIANLQWNASEIVRFFKYVRNLFSVGKKSIFFKIGECDKFVLERIKWYYFIKMSFHLNCEFFCNEKSENF